MSDKMIDELKPCPFCGSKDVGINDDSVPQCYYCGATTPTRCGTREGVMRWNRRHEATEPLAVLADRKGCSLTKRIELVNWLEGDDKKTVWHEFTGPTYSACEAKARAYLNGLTDAAGKGDN